MDWVWIVIAGAVGFYAGFGFAALFKVSGDADRRARKIHGGDRDEG
ncbi:hypothetical protein [Numidum massiliense]|nr:hypothetical protein [Numidum massiliense]